MRHSFNLVDNPWIPVIWLNGESACLGVEEILSRAHEIREIYDDSPLITASLHRLLLAVVHHNFGPADANAWKSLWEQGKFDGNSLHSYLCADERHARFDLFDDVRPFYQTVEVPFSVEELKQARAKDYTVSVAKMSHAAASGNNDTLFDHSLDDTPLGVSPARAACLLLAIQNYAMGGMVSAVNVKDKFATAGSLVKGAVTIVRGSNLFETLMLNLVGYNGKKGLPFSFKQQDDLPAWDRPTSPQPETRRVTGYLDLLTWQSRRVRLHPEVDAQGGVIVRRTVLMKGEQFLDAFHRFGHETMVAFKHNLDPKATDPHPAVGFSEDRAIWRSSLALYTTASDSAERPRTLDWLHQLAEDGHLDVATVFPLDLFGLSSDQAKVLLWRHERLPLPLKLLGSEPLLADLGKALEAAENVGRAVSKGAWNFAKLLLLRDPTKQPSTEQKKDIQGLVSSLDIERRYWSRLQSDFNSFLTGLPEKTTTELRDIHLADWFTILEQTAHRSFAEVVGREDCNARVLKARIHAEGLFAAALRKVLPTHTDELSPAH